MVFTMVFLKLVELLVYKLLANSCYKAAMKVKNYGFFSKTPLLRSQQYHTSPNFYPSVTKCVLQNRGSQTMVCDIDGTLLKSHSFFPYFMLVAFEGGNILRAFLLLLSYPLIYFLNYKLKLRVMIFITFCGLRLKDMDSVGRAVLPKFYLENLNLQVYEVWAATGCKVVCTSVPRVMIEWFLKEYMSVDNVLGTELHTSGKRFTGLLTTSGLLLKHKAVKEFFGENRPDIAIGTTSNSHDHHFLSLCKEAYMVTKEDLKNRGTTTMPRERYPKPLIFHDGRLAFLPTPLHTLAMFLWLLPAILLAIFRLVVGIYLPYKLAIFFGCLSGLTIQIKGSSPPGQKPGQGVLYVCTHRTLLDPVFLSTSLAKPLTAVTYSLSKVSEVIAPIKTVRLTRDRTIDGATMQKLLSEGDLVVCPEGTTCREPYLLRFSSLFAELAQEIVPVAIDTKVGMFYGTTASGLKCLDPVFFLMNPRPGYFINVLGKMPRELTCAGGKTSHDVANYIQRQLADALGFECTSLTRRDKYLMLAGNEGVVKR